MVDYNKKFWTKRAVSVDLLSILHEYFISGMMLSVECASNKHMSNLRMVNYGFFVITSDN